MTYLLLLKKPSFQALLPKNILSGFESTGTWPYNRDVSSKEDFAPAITTDRLFTPDNDIPPDNSISVSASAATALEPGRTSDSSHDEKTQKTETSTTIEDLAPSTSHAYVSPRDVYSIPKAQPLKSKDSSRKGKTQILSVTPVREKIALLRKQREAKKLLKTKKVKKNFFRKKPVSSSESYEKDEADQIEYDDDSDCLLDDNIIEGDFVIVNETGRGRQRRSR